jgi:hypothetical protein
MRSEPPFNVKLRAEVAKTGWLAHLYAFYKGGNDKARRQRPSLILGGPPFRRSLRKSGLQNRLCFPLDCGLRVR